MNQRSNQPARQGSRQIQKRDPAKVKSELFGLLSTDKVRQQISAALAGAFDIDKYVRMAMSAYSRGDDNLKKAHPVSIVGAIVTAAQAGLSLDGLSGECYIVARWNKHVQCHWASIMVGYPGLMKRAMRAQDVAFDMQAVFEGDEFEYQLGTTPQIVHRRGENPPKLKSNGEPEVKCAYAIAHFANGHKRVYVMPKWEIEKTRMRSGRPNDGAWQSDYGAMAAKSALRRLCKTCPMDDKTTQLITQEERAEVGKFDIPEGFDDLFDFVPPDADDDPTTDADVPDGEGAEVIDAEAVEADPAPPPRGEKAGPKPTPTTIDELKEQQRKREAEEAEAAAAKAKAKAEKEAEPKPKAKSKNKPKTKGKTDEDDF